MPLILSGAFCVCKHLILQRFLRLNDNKTEFHCFKNQESIIRIIIDQRSIAFQNRRLLYPAFYYF